MLELSADPATVVAGQPVEFTLTVRNSGQVAAGLFYADFYSHRTTPPATFEFGDLTCEIDSLAPAATILCIGDWTYPSAGSYQTWGQVDPDEFVSEGNEGNNVFGPVLITVLPDSDGDSVADSLDNCPNWPNPGQTLPIWSVPAGDSDCDGFTNARETYLTTSPTLQCTVNDTANNEPPPDRWPFDMNDDRRVNTVDIGFFIGKLGLDNTEAGWTARMDLNQSPTGIINTVDIGLYIGRLGNVCLPSGP